VAVPRIAVDSQLKGRERTRAEAEKILGPRRFQHNKIHTSSKHEDPPTGGGGGRSVNRKKNLYQVEFSTFKQTRELLGKIIMPENTYWIFKNTI